MESKNTGPNKVPGEKFQGELSAPEWMKSILISVKILEETDHRAKIELKKTTKPFNEELLRQANSYAGILAPYLPNHLVIHEGKTRNQNIKIGQITNTQLGWWEKDYFLPGTLEVVNAVGPLIDSYGVMWDEYEKERWEKDSQSTSFIGFEEMRRKFPSWFIRLEDIKPTEPPIEWFTTRFQVALIKLLEKHVYPPLVLKLAEIIKQKEAFDQAHQNLMQTAARKREELGGSIKKRATNTMSFLEAHFGSPRLPRMVE